METLSGKVAVVMGGSSGIGKAVAARLARSGARVTIVGRQKEKLERAVSELAREGTVTGWQTDLSDRKATDELTTRLSVERPHNAKLREQIALAVSEGNQCEYCLSAHTAIGKMVGLADADLVSAPGHGG